ncbi:MAG: DUF5686 family protein [Gemmatimonadetes bacterium]|nr:DUF5686 family protein [Gemmatimonadota bacterium]
MGYSRARQKTMIRFLPLFFSVFLWSSILSAQTDSTSVLDAQCRDADTGASLPYVTVVIRRSGEFPRVHITDLHGRIEIEGLAPGIAHVQARRQGYAPFDTTLVLSRGLISTLELSLLSIPILLREETAVQEHSATDLIRLLIANTRFEYLHTGYANMATYAFDAYSSQKVINRKTEEIVAGIEYTIKGYHQSPDRIAQHITGIRNWGKWRLSVSPGLTQSPARGIVDDKSFEIVPHPLSPDALEHYHYERISTVQVGDLHVSRLGVSPRHGHKPGLLGDLWIARDDFSLVGYDLRLNFPALLQLRGIDHWQVYQQNTRYLNEYWLPERQICTIKTRDYTAQATTRCYRYDLNTDLPSAIFEAPEIVILPEATTRDSSFWAAHAADRDTAHLRMKGELLQGNLPAAWKKQLGIKN